MSNVGNERPRPKGNSPLAQWFHETVGLKQARVQFRLRGNNLHILCEDQPCPDQTATLTRLLLALQQIDLNTLIPANQPQIYQVFVYGRRPEQNRPDWSAPIDLNQLDHHLELLNQARVGQLEFSTPLTLVPTPSRESQVSSSVPAAAAALYPPADRLPSRRDVVARQDAAALPERPEVPPDSALQQSNLSLARQGNPEAIARYLSESLSVLGVAVQVTVKTVPYPQGHVSTTDGRSLYRLGITCEATYYPESSLLAEPIAQKLRDLQLENFRDAIVQVQVAGEAAPDWVLRVDLTPPDEMLREWARWGDVGSLTRLLNQALSTLDTEVVTASLRDSTLHLVCSPLANRSAGDGSAGDGSASHESASHESASRGSASNGSASNGSASYGSASVTAKATAALANRQSLRSLILLLLESIAPQGIHAASVYGQLADQEVPAWVEWLTLPASHHAALAEPPLAVAKQGDWGAIAFLLNRLLNPDLSKQLETGGTRLQLLPKADFNSTDVPPKQLLHVMSDAPLCPNQAQVSKAVVRFLKELNLPNLSGVRVYGRRAGQKRPLWSYGADFGSRSRLVPEPAPEFAATDAYVGDLLTSGGDLVPRPDLNPPDIQTAWVRLCDRLTHGIRQILIQTQLVVSSSDPTDATTTQLATVSAQDVKTVLIWGVTGVLLAVQVDWGLERLVRSQPTPTASAKPVSALIVPTDTMSNDDGGAAENPAPVDSSAVPPESPLVSRSPSGEAQPTSIGNSTPKPDIFDSTEFTQSPQPAPTASPAARPSPARPSIRPSVVAQTATPTATLPYTPVDPKTQAIAANLLAAGSPFPTFNSRQLDEKLTLYYERLKTAGRPPDVMVVGSSRALRGIDPLALQAQLAALGYVDATVFNFGINGATAQVVDLVLRQVLTPEQLPRLVIWADGARAFNSGTVDVTYSGIAVSQGYRALQEGRLSRPNVLPQPSAPTELSDVDGETVVEPEAVPADNNGIGTSLRNSYQTLDRWLSEQLAQISSVHADRDRLKNLLQRYVSGVQPQPPADLVIGDGAQASSPASVTQSLSEGGRDLIDFNGFLPLPLRFNPATYFQEYTRVDGRYDGDYENFRINGAQAEAFRELLQFTRSRQIPVVFLNLPLTKEYLDPIRLAHEQTFQQYMLQEALRQPGFIFRNLNDLWLKQYDYFSDPSHLNRYGAYAISRRVAQDPMIPWSDVIQK